MRILKTAAAMLFAGAVLITSSTANAYGDGTPDGSPPAEEQVCDTAGISGVAYGLCIAFCEANDCDMTDRPYCAKLRKNYVKRTGEQFFPCELQEGDGEPN